MKSSWTGGETARPLPEVPPIDLLALEVQRQQPGAFERLIATYEQPLFRYVQRLLQNHHDAQEVVQDSFLRAHRALTRKYTADQCAGLAVKPWLFRIARNLALNKRRGLRQVYERSLPEIDDNGFKPVFAGSGADSEIERRQDAERLDRALAVLPTDVRELIILRFIEEMSYSDISRATGLNEASLRGRVFRALKSLRDVLAEREVPHAV